MSAETPTSPTGSKPRAQEYEGGCHCGHVKYTVKASPPIEDGPVTACNCSICHINGYLMIYPLETNITWLSGFQEMTQYKFGLEQVAHFFCPNCGTAIGAKSNDPAFFQDNRAVNVRTLRNVDIDKLKLRKVDGKSRNLNDRLKSDSTPKSPT